MLHNLAVTVMLMGLLLSGGICSAQPRNSNLSNDLFVIEWDPETRPPLDLEEMEAAATRLLAAGQDQTKAFHASVLVRRARIRQWLGDDEGFLADCTAAYQDDPENVYVQFVYGARFSADPLLVDEAAAIARQLIKNSPDQPHGYALSALVHSRRGELKECISMATETHKRSPRNVSNIIVRSQAYARAGMFGESLKDIELARNLPPASDGVMAELDEVQGVVLAASDRHAEAIPFLHRATYSYGTERSNIRDALWLCYVAQFMPASSLSVSRQQTKQFPDYARGHSQLAMSEAYFGRSEVALTASKAAVRLSPNESFHWATIARVHESRGEYDLAIESLRRAVRLSKDRDRDGLLRLAFLLSVSPAESQRDQDEAYELCSRAFAKEYVIQNPYAWIARACIEGNSGNFPDAYRSIDKAATSAEVTTGLKQAVNQLRSDFKSKQSYRLQTDFDKSYIRMPILGWLISARQ